MCCKNNGLTTKIKIVIIIRIITNSVSVMIIIQSQIKITISATVNYLPAVIATPLVLLKLFPSPLKDTEGRLRKQVY